jgi:hypothetical protein
MNSELAALEQLITDRAKRQASQLVRETFQTLRDEIRRLTGVENLQEIQSVQGMMFVDVLKALQERTTELTTKDLAYKLAADILRRQDSLLKEEEPEEYIPDDGEVEEEVHWDDEDELGKEQLG